MKIFADGDFDAVIDKGCIDCVLVKSRGTSVPLPAVILTVLLSLVVCPAIDSKLCSGPRRVRTGA